MRASLQWVANAAVERTRLPAWQPAVETNWALRGGSQSSIDAHLPDPADAK